MNILQLKYAMEVAKTGSIKKAAENLYMAQPNLSRAIKELESSLGITVFDRNAKGMTLTPDGEKLIAYGERILRQVDELEAIFKEEHEEKATFSISVPRACYISQAFAQFSWSLVNQKKAEIFYKETNASRAINNILHADYKLGIIRYAEKNDKHFKEMLDDKGLVGELVTEFKYRLIMSKEHPLASKKDIRYDDLKDYIEIAHADPYVPSLPLSAVKKEELPDNVSRRIFVFERASQLELLSENTETFMWVSPAPQKLLDKYGLLLKDCSENTKIYKDVLIYKKDYRLSELDKVFITELCNAKRKIM